MNRRSFVIGVATAAALPALRVRAAEITIPQVPLAGTSTPIGTPTASSTVYSGEIGDLWLAPWNIGDQVIEITGTIVQRFIGAKGMGYKLSDDGVVVRNAFRLYANGQGVSLLVGTNQDIDQLANAKTLKVKGYYGGISSSPNDWPIVLAFELANGA